MKNKKPRMSKWVRLDSFWLKKNGMLQWSGETKDGAETGGSTNEYTGPVNVWLERVSRRGGN